MMRVQCASRVLIICDITVRRNKIRQDWTLPRKLMIQRVL
jgi:hypothetical protein